KTKKRKFMEKLLKNTIVDVTSTVGNSGLNEIISRGILDRVINNTILGEQTKQVQEAFNILAKTPNLITYGKEQVLRAIEEKATETLLVSDKMLNDKEIEKIVEKAKKIHSNIYIIASHHEAGERLYEMGGLIAILRYKL
ncbi:MAG: mRNA surveillance protein Pelota, partial [Candidatus Aenigmarchaeota archaeon]|nr:mRNA surveillance protein Pelota [Candidatus Aenigmarchaeota archaeon]